MIEVNIMAKLLLINYEYQLFRVLKDTYLFKKNRKKRLQQMKEESIWMDKLFEKE